MNRRALLPTLKPKEKRYGQRYLLDSLLALGSIFSLTAMVWLFHLYQRIPDSFLVYMLAILSLASLRGLYPALLASFVAFFSFDFFFVPPLYNLSAAKFEDVLTLVVFLVTAIITSQFASTLRHHAQDASRRERETHILYDLVRATNREEDLELQLSIFVRAVVEVFFPWGIRDCLLLLPDAQGVLIPRVSARQPIERMELSTEEKARAQQMQTDPRTVDLFVDASQCDPLIGKNVPGPARECYVRMVPLKTEKVIGVLRLLIEQDGRGITLSDPLCLERAHPTSEAVFFSTFLEQAVTVIEHGHLRQENLRIEVLQRTDALRSALLSSVSHDLRTPLSTIKTAATSLGEEDVQWDDEARCSFLADIERETDRLNSLVENLLDMSRIEAGLLRLEKVWYPLDELVRDVLERMASLFTGRMVQISLPDHLPPVELDAVMIDQVLTNLLENVIRHTPAGTPVETSIQRGETDVVVSIADRGPGIAPAEHEQIFDAFYRVRGGTPPRDGRCSGLGLAICRGLVEAHGGKIWVEAREGGGAVFRFTLPLSDTGALEL